MLIFVFKLICNFGVILLYNFVISGIIFINVFLIFIKGLILKFFINDVIILLFLFFNIIFVL